MSIPQDQPSAARPALRRPPGRRDHRRALCGAGIVSFVAVLLLSVVAAGGPVNAETGPTLRPPTSAAGLPFGVSTVFGSEADPASDARRGHLPVELGLRFSARSDGVVLGLRIYRPAGLTGAQTATLWTDSGTRLATVVTRPTYRAGWLYVALRTPVAVMGNSVYVASYHTADGYVSDRDYFDTSAAPRGLVRPALIGDEVDPRNGVFRYGRDSTFPDRSYRSTNYWIDVVFSPRAGTSPTATTQPSPPSSTPTTPRQTTPPPTTPPTTPPPWQCLTTCPPTTPGPSTTPTGSPTPTCLSCPPPTPTETTEPTETTDPTETDPTETAPTETVPTGPTEPTDP